MSEMMSKDVLYEPLKELHDVVREFGLHHGFLFRSLSNTVFLPALSFRHGLRRTEGHCPQLSYPDTRISFKF